LRDEYRVYSAAEAAFIPELVGWHDGEQTLLAIADLSDAYWPPPWSLEQIDAVCAALDELHATPPPEGLPRVSAERDWLNGWELVAEDAEPILSTGLCSPGWLEHALPTLLETGRTCPLEGEAFLHLDVRSDNLCLQAGRAVLVDWNFAHVGNPLLDIVCWLPSLKLEGGPDPWELVPDSDGFAALLAGYFAAHAGLPPPATAQRVREFQRRQAEVALPWAARELGLPQP
jgi:aminoglycoside phosphotransferase (APT) family kinase protein